jgi:hypothetical protein
VEHQVLSHRCALNDLHAWARATLAATAASEPSAITESATIATVATSAATATPSAPSAALSTTATVTVTTTCACRLLCHPRLRVERSRIGCWRVRSARRLPVCGICAGGSQRLVRLLPQLQLRWLLATAAVNVAVAVAALGSVIAAAAVAAAAVAYRPMVKLRRCFVHASRVELSGK